MIQIDPPKKGKLAKKNALIWSQFLQGTEGGDKWDIVLDWRMGLHLYSGQEDDKLKFRKLIWLLRWH